MTNGHSFNETKFNQLPKWARDAIAKLGKPYAYIGLRIVEERNSLFIDVVKPEIESALLGTMNPDSQYTLSAEMQRYQFMVKAIQFAHYYRPKSSNLYQTLPKHLSPEKKQSAVEDLKYQRLLRKKIERASKTLANLLRQHDLVTQSVGVEQIACDPFDLIFRANRKHPTLDFFNDFDEDFDRLQTRRGFYSRPTYALSFVIDQLAELAGESDRSLISSEVQLGISSRKTDFHFLDAFEIWLSENKEGMGGFIPDGFKLSDECWAALITCLTYYDGSRGKKVCDQVVDPKSVRAYRERAKNHREKGYLTPTDILDLVESWPEWPSKRT